MDSKEEDGFNRGGFNGSWPFRSGKQGYLNPAPYYPVQQEYRSPQGPPQQGYDRPQMGYDGSQSEGHPGWYNRYVPLEGYIDDQIGMIFLGHESTKRRGGTGGSTQWKHIWSRKKRWRGRRAGRKLQKKKVPTGEGIFNLSGVPLNSNEIKVLDKGLKFAPTNNLNKFETYVNILKYMKKLNIKKHFISNTTGRTARNNSLGTGLRNKSIFNPPSSDNKFTEVFKNMVVNDLEQLKIRKVHDPEYIRRGIQFLEDKKEVVIGPADKGRGGCFAV